MIVGAARTEHDVIILGGGINGVGIARDCALRGLADGLDLFVIHVEATDEAGHAGDVAEKVGPGERHAGTGAAAQVSAYLKVCKTGPTTGSLTRENWTGANSFSTTLAAGTSSSPSITWASDVTLSCGGNSTSATPNSDHRFVYAQGRITQ